MTVKPETVTAISEAVARHLRRQRTELREEIAELRAELGECRREAAAARAIAEEKRR